MYVLRFEDTTDGFAIVLVGREKPIGYICRLNGGWFGKMALDGYKVALSAADPNEIASEFQTWVADGLPPPNSRLEWDREKALIDLISDL
jgi:hypothetical protein